MGNGLAIYNDTDFVITCEASMGIIHKSENHVQPGQTFYYHSGAVWMTLTAYPTTSTTTVSAYRRAKRNQARMKLITDIAKHASTIAMSVSDLSPNKAVVAATCLREAAKVCETISTTSSDTDVPGGLATSNNRLKELLIPILGENIDKKEVRMLIDTSVGLKLKAENEAPNAADPYKDGIVVRYLLGQLEKSDLYADKSGCYGGWNGTWLKLTDGPKYIDNNGDGSWKAGDFEFVKMKNDEIETFKNNFTPSSKRRYDAHNPSQHGQNNTSQSANQTGVGNPTFGSSTVT